MIRNISFLKTLVLCFNVQKFFILALALLYFFIYITLFLYYGADFGYLSGIYDGLPNMPEMVIAIFDVIPTLAMALILSYTTFSVHQNYMRDQKANLSMLKNALNKRENFKFFLNQYIISAFIILIFFAIAIPLFFKGNIFIKIIIFICVICGISLFMAKPYISLYYKRAIGIIDLYCIMKSILFPYICGFTIFLMIIFFPVIIGSFISNLISYHIMILLIFDFITALMMIAAYVFISAMVAYFSYKAICYQGR